MKNSIENFILKNYRILFHIIGNCVSSVILYITLFKDLTNDEFYWYLAVFVMISYFVNEFSIKYTGLDKAVEETIEEKRKLNNKGEN